MLQLCSRFLFCKCSLIIVFLAFLASACSDKEIVNDASLNDMSFQEEIRLKTNSQWDAIVKKNPELFSEKDGKLVLKRDFTENSGITEDDICDCSVEVVSIDWDNPNGYPGTALEFYSALSGTSACSASPSMPNGCPYFNISYGFNGGENCSTSTSPNCVDYVNSSPLTGTWGFNCDVPAYSTLPIWLAGFSSGVNCLDVSPLIDVYVTFKIHCVGKYYTEDCTRDTGGESLYSSNEIRIAIPSAMYYTSNPIVISLSGCGCEPSYFQLP